MIGSGLPDGSSLSSLTDPTTIAATAPSDPSLGRRMLALQLKLHLLTAQHVALSQGFLYDNPALWSLMRGQFADVLAQPTMDNLSTVVIQVNDVGSGAESYADALFRAWAFGDDGKRRLQPSAAHLLGLDEQRAASAVSGLDRSATTMERYAEALGFDELALAAPSIRAALLAVELRAKPTDRYEIFGDLVRDFTIRARIGAEKAATAEATLLLRNLDRLERHVPAKGALSRGELAEIDSELWWYFAPMLNHLRLLGYLPKQTDATISSSPSKILEGLITEPVAKGLRDATASPYKKDKWAVALDKLSFHDIIKIREQDDFRQALYDLSSMRASAPGDEYARYKDVLLREWAPALKDAVARIAPHCVVGRSPGMSWESPTALVGAAVVSGFIYLNGVGKLDLAEFLASIPVLAVGASAAIQHAFSVDSPEKSAALITEKVLRSL